LTQLSPAKAASNTQNLLSFSSLGQGVSDQKT